MDVQQIVHQPDQTLRTLMRDLQHSLGGSGDRARAPRSQQRQTTEHGCQWRADLMAYDGDEFPVQSFCFAILSVDLRPLFPALCSD